MLKRNLVLIVFLLVLAVTGAAAFFYPQLSSFIAEKESDVKTLRVLYGEWPPDLIAYLAQEKGYFEEEGVSVELVKIGGFEELFELVDNNEADVWPVTLLDAIIAYSEGKDWQIFLVEDYSAGADAVLVAESQTDIESIEDLKGKTVGLEEGTVGEFFLQILLSRSGSSLEDLEIVDMSFDEIPAALADGSIDAGVTYEPAVTESVNQGARVLVDTEKERGVIADVYAAHQSELENYSEEYKKFMRAILKAADFYNENPEEAAEIMKEPFESDTDELLEGLSNLQITTHRDNQTAFDRNSGFASLYTGAKQAEQYLEEEGIITPAASLNELFSNLIDELNYESE